jgi:T5SS/PEP-CTERM-associated repeat protein
MMNSLHIIANKRFYSFITFLAAPFIFAVYFFATPLPARAAATYYWVGGTTNSNTSNPANWKTSAGACADSANLNIPGPTDTVTFVSNCLNSATVDSALSVKYFKTNPGYTGTVTVSGVSVIIATQLVADGGTFYVSNGGTVTAPPGGSGIVIGNASTGNGTITVTGSGSSLTQTISGDTRVRMGNFTGSVGNLNILNGATVSTGNISAAYDVGTTANIEVGGANTVWNSDIAGGLGYIGRGLSGTATLTISNGAVVNTAAGPWQIGGLAGSNGSVTVTGTGSQLNFTAGTPRVGYSGTGTLNVINGGVVNRRTGSIIVAALAGSTGTLNIGAGYTMDSVIAESIGPGLGTAYLPPIQPTGLTSSTVSQTSISWDWDDVAGATGYKVYNAADNTLLTTITSATSNWTQDILDPNSSYSVYVRGVNAQGVGYASASASATTEAIPTPAATTSTITASPTTTTEETSTVVQTTSTVTSQTTPVLSLLKMGTINFNEKYSQYYYTGHRPTFSGIASPNSSVTVTIHSDPITCSTITDNAGNWSCTPTSDIPNGDHTVTIQSVGTDGQYTLASFKLGINIGLAATGDDVSQINLWLIITLSASFFAILLVRNKLKIKDKNS